MSVSDTFIHQTSDYDTDLIIDGARAAIMANVAVHPYLKLPGDDVKLLRVFPERALEEDRKTADGVARSKLAKVVLNLPSVVEVKTYSHVQFNALLDFSVYKEGWANAVVRTLIVEIIRSLVVLPWTVSGARLISSSMQGPGTGFRPISEITAGAMTRGKAGTARVIIERT